MALRRLYDKVDLSKSSFKVLERKEKVIIALAKFEPPNYGQDSYVNYKPWYRLHLNSTDNTTITQELEQDRLQRAMRMNDAAKPPSVPSATTKRR